MAPSEDPIVVEPWDRRGDRRAVLLLFVFAWVVYLATAHYTVNQINDTRAATQSAWSLGVRGTFALPEEWRGEIDWETEGTSRRLFTDRFPGPVIWGAPFHAAGHVLFPREEPGHPYLLNYAPSGVAAATATALGVPLTFVLHRRLTNRRLAVAGTLAVAFGTGVWTIASTALWTHSLTYPFLMLGVLAAADDRHGRSGLAFAGAILARPQVAVVAAVVGIWRGVVQRRLQPVFIMGATSALGVVSLSLYSHFLFGTWRPVAGYEISRVTHAGSTALDPNGISLWVGSPWLELPWRVALTLGHPLRGILVYVPVLLVLLPTLRHGWRASPPWVRSAAVSGVIYMLVQLRVNDYHGGGGFFGSRLTIELLALASPLLLRTWQVYVSRDWFLRRVGLVALTGGIALHALGATVWAFPGVDTDALWTERMAEVCHVDHPPRGC